MSQCECGCLWDASQCVSYALLSPTRYIKTQPVLNYRFKHESDTNHEHTSQTSRHGSPPLPQSASRGEVNGDAHTSTHHTRAMRFLLAVIISAAAASTLHAPPASLLACGWARCAGRGRDRHREDDSDTQTGASGSKLPIPPSKALTKMEIMEKLNAIPVFCILNKENGVVGMRAVDDDAPSCCWFTDPMEARCSAGGNPKSNPEAGLHMGCHGLGAVFTRCGGWPAGEEPEGYKMPEESPQSADGEKVLLKLKGQHGLYKEVQPRLVELLKGSGMDPGCWQLPIFFGDELQSRSIVPVFLSPQDLAATWVKPGARKSPSRRTSRSWTFACWWPRCRRTLRHGASFNLLARWNPSSSHKKCRLLPRPLQGEFAR